jgi:hypothetical protein
VTICFLIGSRTSGARKARTRQAAMAGQEAVWHVVINDNKHGPADPPQLGSHAHGPVNRLRGTGSDEISTNHFPNSAKTG